jgi:hypothetical protein
MPLSKNEKVPKTLCFQGFFGLGERIRTSGLLNPIQRRSAYFQGFSGLMLLVGD